VAHDLLGVAAEQRTTDSAPPVRAQDEEVGLPGFDLAKGTVRFTVENSLPEDAVRGLVRRRMAEIAR